MGPGTVAGHAAATAQVRTPTRRFRQRVRMLTMIAAIAIRDSLGFKVIESGSMCMFSARGADVYRDAESYLLYRRAILGSAEADLAFRPAEGQLPRWNPKTPDEPQMPSLPPVDWKSSQVIAVHAGSCPTGGYKLTIRRIVAVSQNTIEVDAHLQKPGPHDIVFQMVTHPWVNISTARAPAQIRLRWI